MKLILVHKTAASRTLEFGRWSWAALSVICIGLPLGLMGLGYELGQRQGTSMAQEARLSTAELEASKRASELAQLSADARRKLTMTRRLAELQVRVTRLDALGTHLTAWQASRAVSSTNAEPALVDRWQAPVRWSILFCPQPLRSHLTCSLRLSMTAAPSSMCWRAWYLRRRPRPRRFPPAVQ